VSNDFDQHGAAPRLAASTETSSQTTSAWNRASPHASHVKPVGPSHGEPIVFVVDDDISVRESLEGLIRFAGWQTEVFASAPEFLARPGHSGPSCMVLDVNLPELSGLELQRHIASASVKMPIIFITGFVDVPVAVQAMKAGAVDFLTKPVGDEILLQAIESSLSRSRAAIDGSEEIRSIQANHATLSLREREVMNLVVSGLLNKQIGGELGISEITVKAHRGSAMRKMKARSLAHLVEMAIKLRESAGSGEAD
jgi:FixJ family two-component response regulator